MLALAAVGLVHRRIHHLLHHRRDVHADAVTLDERDDGLVGHADAGIGVYAYLLAPVGGLILSNFMAGPTTG